MSSNSGMQATGKKLPAPDAGSWASQLPSLHH
jgi:hypothetical protein